MFICPYLLTAEIPQGHLILQYNIAFLKSTKHIMMHD